MERNEVRELYEKHARCLATYARRLLGDVDLAQDVVHETFMAALRQDAEFMPCNPRAWLYAVARNRALSALRHRTALPLTQDPPAPAAEGSEDRIERIHRAIQKLPEAMRETLELKLEHAMSYQDIAAILEVPIGTVRSRVHNAIQRLREQLLGGRDPKLSEETP